MPGIRRATEIPPSPKDLGILYAEYVVMDGSGHTHAAFAGMEEGAESCALLLAEAVANCGEGQHVDQRGHFHGVLHPHAEAENAFDHGMVSLFEKDTEGEWMELVRDIRAWNKWSGPVPKLVLIPDADNPKQWKALTTNPDGEPTLHDVKKGVLDDMMPPPEEGKTAYRDPILGWQRKKKLSLDSKIRRRTKNG